MALCLVAGTLVAPATAGAQTTALEFDRPEAWAMKFAVGVATFTGFGVPVELEDGEFEVGVEVGNVPRLSDAERRVGFNGTKLEDMNKSPVFARIRGRFGVGAGWAAELGFVPPVRVEGAQPLMLAGALGGVLTESYSYRVGARIHGQIGRIRGDITCDEATVAAPPNTPANEFSCEAVSNDEMVHAYSGVEVSASWLLGSVEPYLTVSGTYVDAEFRVDAQYAGLASNEIFTANGGTLAGALGAAIALSDEARMAVEVFYTPLSVVRPPETDSGVEGLFNVRALFSYAFR